jgi:hypothetical protein
MSRNYADLPCCGVWSADPDDDGRQGTCRLATCPGHPTPSKGTMYQIPSLWIAYYNPTPRIAIDTGICGIKVWKGRPEVSHPLRFSS